MYFAHKKGNNIGESTTEEKAEAVKTGIDESKAVFVNNLSFKVTEEELRSFFEESGKVASVKIPENFEGKSRGYGYVNFVEVSSVEEALKRNGEEVRGRKIKVEKSARNLSKGKSNPESGSPKKMNYVGGGGQRGFLKNQGSSRGQFTGRMQTIVTSVLSRSIQSGGTTRGYITDFPGCASEHEISASIIKFFEDFKRGYAIGCSLTVSATYLCFSHAAEEKKYQNREATLSIKSPKYDSLCAQIIHYWTSVP